MTQRPADKGENHPFGCRCGCTFTTPTPAASGGTESPNCQGWPGREAVDGVCCTCGYHGTEETPCPSRSDKTHCVHWWEGDGEVTPPASAPGSGEVTAWGCEVDELVERIDRMTVEAGPGLDLRPHHQRMLIKEIWRLTEAVERARAEGEAKGRRQALEWACKRPPLTNQFGQVYEATQTYVLRGEVALAALAGGGE